MKIVTVNGREVNNPLAQILIVLTVFTLIACIFILIGTFLVALIPFLIIFIIVGAIVHYGNKKRKN